MLPLLIFDLDGTLIDSEEGIIVTLQKGAARAFYRKRVCINKNTYWVFIR